MYAAHAAAQRTSQSSKNPDTNLYHSNFHSGDHLSSASTYQYDQQGNNNNQYYHDAFFNECLQNKNQVVKDYLPESMILIKYLNETKVDLFGLYLFDSGSKHRELTLLMKL